MKNVIESFARPFNYSLLIGVAVGTLVYYVGAWTVPHAQKSAQQEFQLISHRITETLLVSDKSNNKTLGTLLIKEALKKAVKHPKIVSARIRSGNNAVPEMVVSQDVVAVKETFEFNHPIANPEGQFLGSVTLELTEDATSITNSLINTVWFYAAFGFLLSFSIVFWWLRRREGYLNGLVSALKSVSKGNFDFSLPTPQTRSQAEVSEAFKNLIEDIRERDRMRHSLGRIMDPKIAQILIKENPKLGGLRRNATILFCDIRNYTTICEEMDVDELQEFLNEYWKGTVEVIMENDGTIDKFHGDGVCVIFGAPNLHKDDPLRAVKSAWGLVKNVEKLNEVRMAKRKPPIQIGIGIHSGEVIAGNIGSERRMDYTVVGDVVNVAARIEELNKKYGTKILISDSVYEQVELYVRVKTLSLAYLRGHKRPILVHAMREFIDIPDQEHNEKVA